VNLTILIVDDETDLLNLIEEEFVHNGFTVVKSTSGFEAVEILKTLKIDVIISDYRMPNGNGFELLQYVSTMSSPPKFFFLTGQLDADLDECMRLGTIQIFSKPFDLSKLSEEIRILLN
jgi:DNA-binding NtrC family response regulator